MHGCIHGCRGSHPTYAHATAQTSSSSGCNSASSRYSPNQQRHATAQTSSSGCSSSASSRRPRSPQIDDQDLLLNSTDPYFMPATNSWIKSQGLTFTDFIACTSLCCPSRTNLMTGRLTHNTNVTSNQAPYGTSMPMSRQP